MLKRKNGLVKVGADFVYPKNILEEQFEQLKQEAHKYDLKFYVGENRLRTMGDDMCCCGIEGIKGFEDNTYNLCNILNNKKYKISDKMKEKDTAICFRALDQTTLGGERLRGKSFEEIMKNEYLKKKKIYNDVFGIT